MKKSRFSETKIVFILARHERGERAIDLCREYHLVFGMLEVDMGKA